MATENYLLGWPVSEAVRAQLSAMVGQQVPPVAPGSIKTPCLECRMLIFMGPLQQQQIIDNREARPVCPWCCAANARGSTVRALGDN